MDYNGKKCFRCAYFHKYYTRGVTKFKDTKFGWCSGRATSVENTECCEKYHPKKFRRGHVDILKIQFNNLLTDISAIRQILEEEINDVKEV